MTEPAGGPAGAGLSRRRVLAASALSLIPTGGAPAVAAAAAAPSGATPLQNTAAGAFPLAVSRDGRSLVHPDGTPAPHLADTAWMAPVALRRSDFTHLCTTRASQGFTALQMSLLAIRAETGGDLRNAYGRSPFHGGAVPDLARPLRSSGYDYWDHVQWLVDEAARHGLWVLLVPAWFQRHGADWRGYLTRATAGPYGTFLAGLLGDRANVGWLQGGDSDPTTANGSTTSVPEGLPRTSAVAAVDALASALRAGSAHAVLQTYHTSRDVAAYPRFTDRSWFTLNPAYSRYQSYARVLEEYDRPTTRPVLLVESYYDARTSGTTGAPVLDRRALRAESWWAWLSGAAGLAYGHEDVWSFESRWKAALEDPSALDQARFNRAVAIHAGKGLRPDQRQGAAVRMLAAGYGSGDDRAASAVAADGSVGLCYFPSARTGVVLEPRALRGPRRAWWYQPGTGALERAPQAVSGGGTVDLPYPRTWDDAVLLVRDDDEPPLPVVPAP